MIAVRSLAALGFLVLLSIISLEARQIRNGRDIGPGATLSSENCSGCVIRLTDSDFDEKVLNSDTPWLVAFYAPWCKWSKRLLPEWTKAANALKDTIKVGWINAEANPVKEEEYIITGYPTIKYFPVGSEPGVVADDYENYNGDHTMADIVSFGNYLTNYYKSKSEREQMLRTTTSTVPPTTETTRATTTTTTLTPTSTDTKSAAISSSPTPATEIITYNAKNSFGSFLTFLENWI